MSRFTVRMDADDPWLVWFEDSVLGRINVYWPEGYGVRFEPDAVVVSSEDRVLFQDGQFVSDSYGVCRNTPGETTITWPGSTD
jgi:hypothetical protein